VRFVYLFLEEISICCVQVAREVTLGGKCSSHGPKTFEFS
jgi:hypothetical protein